MSASRKPSIDDTSFALPPSAITNTGTSESVTAPGGITITVTMTPQLAAQSPSLSGSAACTPLLGSASPSTTSTTSPSFSPTPSSSPAASPAESRRGSTANTMSALADSKVGAAKFAVIQLRPCNIQEAKTLETAPDGSKVEALGKDGTLLSMAKFHLPPNTVSNMVYHQEVEEIWRPLKGKGKLYLWWENLKTFVTFDLTPGEVIFIPAQTHFIWENTESDEELTILGITIPAWPGMTEAQPSSSSYEAKLKELKDKMAMTSLHFPPPSSYKPNFCGMGILPLITKETHGAKHAETVQYTIKKDLSFPMQYAGTSQACLVISGEGELLLDGKKPISLKKDVNFIIPAGEKFHIKPQSEILTVLVTLNGKWEGIEKNESRQTSFSMR